MGRAAIARVLASLVLLGFLLIPASAGAALVEPADTAMEVLTAAGQPDTQAGSHPDRLITRFSFAQTADGKPAENIKDMYLDLPRGFSGNPLAVPWCAREKLLAGTCPGESQVGVAKLTFYLLGKVELPIFDVEPAGEEVAELAFGAENLQVRFRLTLRPEDGGVRMEASEFGREVPLLAGEIELWGVPADHQTQPASPRRAFLSLPTSCGAGPAAVLGVRTWQRPGELQTTPMPLPELGGCAALPFAPTLAVAPSSFDADSPAGLELGLEIPQDEDPDGVTSDQPSWLGVTLPSGFSISPAAAGGLAACTAAQLGAAGVPAACPAGSQIGSIRLRSPALPGELGGGVYLAQTAAGESFRAYAVIERPGVRIKMPVKMQVSAVGVITAQLTNMPQLPVATVAIAFAGGTHALLASPPGCGAGDATAALLAYGGHSASLAARLLTSAGPGGRPCGRGRPFAPTLSVTSTSPVAGRTTTLAITLERADGEQTLAGMRVRMPAGMVADVAGVPRCGAKAIAAAACPAGARIGSTTVAAGPGPTPLALAGDIYLTGPYKGAPFGLAMLVPVGAGPFQLGTATIRAALSLDERSGRLTVATDPLPQSIGGILLRIRTIGIDIERRGFLRNPTSCAAGRVQAKVLSAEGGTARPGAPFRVRGCRDLGFAPRVSLALLGGGRRPGLRIGIDPGDGANLRALTVRLPGSLQASDDLAACPRKRYLRHACPAASLVGSAVARTPLLAGALRGSVRLVQATTVGTPQLWTELRGDGVRLLTTTATAAAGDGRLITRVRSLPDFPLSSLTTTLRSGARSLFRTAKPACEDGGGRAETEADAYNGARSTQLVPLACAP